MDKKLKARWIKALESGRYKQGKGRLKKEDRYCCLGVLREVYSPNYPKGEMGIDAGLLSSRLSAELGISKETQCELAHMNDGDDREQQSFEQIAQWIMKRL